MEIPTRDNAFPRPRMGGFVPAFESPKRVPLRSAQGLQRGRVGVHGHSITSRRLSLGNLGNVMPPEIYPDAITQVNTGDPCPPGWLFVNPPSISGQQNKPQAGSGGLTPWVLRAIHDGGCPVEWMAGKPPAEQAWLCAAINHYVQLFKASQGRILPNPSYGQPQGCFPNLPFHPYEHDDEIAATGHCSEDVFGIACTPGVTALETIQAGEGGPLVPGTQPTAAQIAANIAAGGYGAGAGGSSAPSITTGGAVVPSKPSTPAVQNIVGGIVSDNQQLAADQAAASGDGPSKTILLLALAAGAFFLFGGGR